MSQWAKCDYCGSSSRYRDLKVLRCPQCGAPLPMEEDKYSRSYYSGLGVMCSSTAMIEAAIGYNDSYGHKKSRK